MTDGQDHVLSQADALTKNDGNGGIWQCRISKFFDKQFSIIDHLTNY